MKNNIPKIPRGWRVMRHPFVIKKGDRYAWYGEWQDFTHVIGSTVKKHDPSTCIRRKRPAPPRKGK